MMKDNLSKNITYLLTVLDISIEGLADITSTDVIDIYNLQKDGLEYASEQISTLVPLCNYFTIPLDVMVMDDIEQGGAINHDKLNGLRLEYHEGMPMSRKGFSEMIIKDFEDHGDNGTEEDVQRKILQQIHCIHRMDDKYVYLRKRGRIDKIDFFEKGAE